MNCSHLQTSKTLHVDIVDMYFDYNLNTFCKFGGKMQHPVFSVHKVPRHC